MKRVSGKKLNPYTVVAAGTAIALALGGYLGYRLARGSGMGAADLPAGVEILPQDAVMTLTVTTNEGQWRRLRGLGTLQSRSQFDAQLVRWRDRVLTANGLEYRRDIQPWVGEDVTLAFLPLDSETTPSPSPSPAPDETPQASPEASPEGLATLIDPEQPLPLVAILPIADAGRAQQVLEKAPAATG